MKNTIRPTSAFTGLAVALLLLTVNIAYAQLGTDEYSQRDVTAAETGIGPGPFYNYQGQGADFIKAGVTTRIYLGGVPSPPQTEPFILTIPAMPIGAIAVETFISWSYLLDGTPPANDGITVNGIPVTGNLVGSGTPDVCWQKDGAASYMATGVTGAVNPGNSPVAVTIAGATDKALGSDPNVYGEGLAILVVYSIPSEPNRNVDLYRGYTSTQSGMSYGSAMATLNFTSNYESGDFHFFLNALDGQQTSGDTLSIDGVIRGGQIYGTGDAANAWHGLLGPAPGVNMLYDIANDNISVFLLTPKDNLEFITASSGDCVGHSFAGVSFPIADEIPTLTEWGLIIFSILLFAWMTWAIVRRRKLKCCR
jgi:hypothetical protein